MVPNQRAWKRKNNKKFKEQLVKCTPANSQQCSPVFIEGHSYFPELHPKNIFFNDYDLMFNASNENKLIIKENYVLQWGILQENLQPKLRLPPPIHTQHIENSVVPPDMCNNENSFTLWKNFEHYY